MWKKISQLIFSGAGSTNLNAGRDINLYLNENVPTQLVDERIKQEVEQLRKCRLFNEFDRVRSALSLGRRLREGELAGGSEGVRSRGLAWCARLLARSDELEQAEEFLELAKTLDNSTEARIAEAFLLSEKGDKSSALQTLASINSGASRSAGLMVVTHHEGPEGGLKWMSDAGYSSESLDADGKCFLLIHLLQLGHWDRATEVGGSLGEAEFEEVPVFHNLVALAKLIIAVPGDFRPIVLNQVPFEAADFRLASDAAAMQARRAAREHFLKAAEVAVDLGCPLAAVVNDHYALWLELRDPEQTAYGRSRLESKLRDPDVALSVVPFALQFGVELDLAAVESDIDRHVAATGGLTPDAALARLALAFTRPSPGEAAEYIEHHFDQLAAHIDSKLLLFRQIELFSKGRLISKAKDILSGVVGEGIPPEEEANLQRIIAEAEGTDPIESRRAQYEETKALGDLINLVAELEAHHRWEELSDYGRKLFDETHSIKDAERLVRALNSLHRSRTLVEFLREKPDLLAHSQMLKMSHAWGLYQEGELLESRSVLAELSELSEEKNYRVLKVNLGISTGNWASLASYVSSELQAKENRSANDLLGVAQLALYLGAAQAKDLVFEAASKAAGDPSILAAAYFVATSAGWEDDPQVSQWLERAAELSGDDGPLQRMSLQEIVEKKPEWDRRESETWRLLSEGKLPVFLAAQYINRTVVDLTTFPALANLVESDPRRRRMIPAYSGKREPQEFDVGEKTVALDATALLTLSYLNLLEETLDAFEVVRIPHSTLGWLFEEQQRVAFHQPSRIRSKRRVRDLLAVNSLDPFVPSTVANSELSDQVGDELAALIAEAEKVREEDDSQYIVVRSAPVHRLSSLMQEEADLSAHFSTMSGCLAVVDKLRQKGQLTVEEEKHARAYLHLHEKPWPKQPEIADGANLLLDGLAITYLEDLGLLGKLKNAGLRPVVSQGWIDEADALISYDNISAEVKDVIERVRASLSERIESGQIKVACQQRAIAGVDEGVLEHPTVAIFELASQCDAVVVDDRLVNQHLGIDSDGKLTPVFSTLDVLDALLVAGVISEEDWLEYRTKLRRAGYFLLPVNADELTSYLSASSVVNGQVVETAELKAIRESVLRVRMTNCLQLPNEAPWLDGTLKAFIRVLRGCLQIIRRSTAVAASALQ